MENEPSPGQASCGCGCPQEAGRALVEHSFYLITWSARSSNDCGIVRPRAFAGLEGRSTGFVPLRILSTTWQVSCQVTSPVAQAFSFVAFTRGASHARWLRKPTLAPSSWGEVKHTR